MVIPGDQKIDLPLRFVSEVEEVKRAKSNVRPPVRSLQEVEQLSPTASAKPQSRPILHEGAATTEFLQAVSELLVTIRGAHAPNGEIGAVSYLFAAGY